MRQLILFLGSAGLVAVFFLLPPNRQWLNDRLLPYYKDFDEQRKVKDPQQRMSNRFGAYHSSSLNIASAIKRRSQSDPLVLMPPTAYFKQHGIIYPVPEPVVFYYFTNMRTVWPNSPNAKNANWYVAVSDGTIVVKPVNDPKGFADTLALFNKYEITL